MISQAVQDTESVQYLIGRTKVFFVLPWGVLPDGDRFDPNRIGLEHFAIRRSLDAYSNPGGHEVMRSGGNVCFPEFHDVALLREIDEEAGLTVSDLRTVYSFSGYDTEYYFLLLGFTARTVSEDIVLGDEHIAYQRVTKEEFMILEGADFLKGIVRDSLD